MKYRLKFDYYDAGIQHYENDIFEFNNDESRYDSKRHTKIWLPKSFVEKNLNIFEKIDGLKYKEGEYIKTRQNVICKILEAINNYHYDDKRYRVFNTKTRLEHHLYPSQIKCKVEPVYIECYVYKNFKGEYIVYCGDCTDDKLETFVHTYYKEVKDES